MTWSARRTRREQAQGGIGSVERKAPWLLKRIKKFNSYHMICGVFATGLELHTFYKVCLRCVVAI